MMFLVEREVFDGLGMVKVGIDLFIPIVSMIKCSIV